MNIQWILTGPQFPSRHICANVVSHTERGLARERTALLSTKKFLSSFSVYSSLVCWDLLRKEVLNLKSRYLYFLTSIDAIGLVLHVMRAGGHVNKCPHPIGLHMYPISKNARKISRINTLSKFGEPQGPPSPTNAHGLAPAVECA